MDTSRIGDIVEVEITSALIKLGYTVSKPVNSQSRYDLVIEYSGVFKTIQCKSGRVSNDGATVWFNTSSNKNGDRRDYRNQVDFFGVYCSELDKTYLVPVDEVGISMAHLRIKEPKSKQIHGIRYAKDFECTRSLVD